MLTQLSSTQHHATPKKRHATTVKHDLTFKNKNVLTESNDRGTNVISYKQCLSQFTRHDCKNMYQTLCAISPEEHFSEKTFPQSRHGRHRKSCEAEMWEYARNLYTKKKLWILETNKSKLPWDATDLLTILDPHINIPDPSVYQEEKIS
eukprot:jgi/Psemu1/55711/gm1.55711_g